MKTSEQMTMDVLKRRDEELKALPKKRRIKMTAVGVPCAAAVAVIAFGVHSAVNNTDHFTGNLMGSIFGPGAAEIGKPGYATSYPQDYVTSYNNTELGNEDNIQYVLEYIYKITAMKDVSDIIALEKPLNKRDPDDFIPQTIKQLNSHYGIEFDRFTRLHPNWTETHEPFGLYIHDDNDGFTASRAFMSDRNTLNYVTEDGVEISVTAQQYYNFFDKDKMPVWDETPGNGLVGTVLELDPPEYPDYIPDGKPVQNQPDNETHNIYDDDGNIIGAFTPGYTPDNTRVTDDEYEAHEHVVTTIVYAGLNSTEWLTYLDMGNTWVRIHIKGIPSSAEVIDLLKEYTANPADVSGETANEPENSDDQSWLDEINSLNNPYYGKYSFKFISGESGLLSSINCVEGYPDDSELSKPEYTFWDCGIDYLSQHYWFDFDRLGRLHPDWSKTIDRPLGIYSREESPVVDSFTIVSDYNTLGYTTPDGAKILVTAQTKPFYPAEQILECIKIGEGPFIVLDENGNKIREFEMGFMPHFSVNIPEDAENIEVEIYSDREDPDTHLAYINMGSWVKIRAEGLSDKEFLDLLKEFIK